MMRTTWRVAWIISIFAGAATTTGPSTAKAQWAAAQGRSLGGYGGSMSGTSADMGMSRVIIPYAGQFGGFMSYRMGGSGSLTFQSRGASAMESNRSSFNLSPRSGMSSMSGGMGAGLGVPSNTVSAFGSPGGIGSGGGMSSMSGSRGMGVMPPSFGYPFRQPPSLLSPSSSSLGMSM
jgi:hypothetical protein